MALSTHRLWHEQSRLWRIVAQSLRYTVLERETTFLLSHPPQEGFMPSLTLVLKCFLSLPELGSRWAESRALILQGLQLAFLAVDPALLPFLNQLSFILTTVLQILLQPVPGHL